MSEDLLAGWAFFPVVVENLLEKMRFFEENEKFWKKSLNMLFFLIFLTFKSWNSSTSTIVLKSTCLVQMALRSSLRGSRKAFWQVASQNKMQPRAQMSVAFDATLSRRYSGDIKRVVPRALRRMTASLSGPRGVAQPKSITFKVRPQRIKLLGLRSQWIISENGCC